CDPMPDFSANVGGNLSFAAKLISHNLITSGPKISPRKAPCLHTPGKIAWRILFQPADDDAMNRLSVRVAESDSSQSGRQTARCLNLPGRTPISCAPVLALWQRTILARDPSGETPRPFQIVGQTNNCKLRFLRTQHSRFQNFQRARKTSVEMPPEQIPK